MGKNDEEVSGLSPQTEAHRERLLARLENQDFAELKTRIAQVLKDHPECRDDDAILTIELYRAFYPNHIKDGRLPLDSLLVLPRGETIKRTRAVIQNRLGLFPPSPEVAARRFKRQTDLRAFFRNARSVEAATLIYCDESGLTREHLIVGGIWLDDTVRRIELTEDVRAWESGPPRKRAAKFSHINRGNLDSCKAFFKILERHREHIQMNAVVTPMSSFKSKDNCAKILYGIKELICRGTESGVSTGRYDLPRQFRCVKHRDTSIDLEVIPDLVRETRNALRIQFDGNAILHSVTSQDIEENAFLQFTDLYCGALNRLANETSGSHPKDTFAQYVVQSLGIEVKPPFKTSRASVAQVWWLPDPEA